MGLLGNGFRENTIGKLFGGTSLNGANPSVHEYRGYITARMRNQFAGEGITNRLASVPAGKRHPNVWIMAQEGGSISSFKRTNLEISGTAVGELGFPRSGSTTITIDGTAAGGLIVGATGTATITIDGNAAIVASLSSTGTATITIDGNAVLGAIASMTGQATITVDGSSTIMGLGTMAGSTIETTELTPASIATAVWQALATENNTAGSMGNKMNSAASGGVDYEALGAAVWASVSRTLTAGAAPDTTAIANAVLAALNATTIPVDTKKMNGATLVGDGTSGNKWRG